MDTSYEDYRLNELTAGSNTPPERDPPRSGPYETSQAPQPHPASHPNAHPNAEVLKVSTRSRPSAVAGAIAGVIRESGIAEVQSIGAGATNQAIKAVAIARSYLTEEGIDIYCVPSFIDVNIDEEERTAIKLVIQRRDR